MRAIIAFALLCCSCVSTVPLRPVHVTTRASARALYASAVRELVAEGYEVGTKDRSACVVTTGWKVHDMLGDTSHRDRLVAQCSRGRLQLRLERQQIDAFAKGMVGMTRWVPIEEISEQEHASMQELALRIANSAQDAVEEEPPRPVAAPPAPPPASAPSAAASQPVAPQSPDGE